MPYWPFCICSTLRAHSRKASGNNLHALDSVLLCSDRPFTCLLSWVVFGSVLVCGVLLCFLFCDLDLISISCYIATAATEPAAIQSCAWFEGKNLENLQTHKVPNADRSLKCSTKT